MYPPLHVTSRRAKRGAANSDPPQQNLGLRMGRAIADRRERVFLMTKVCTHGRDARVAMRQLEDS